jgi:hypothetical protein
MRIRFKTAALIAVLAAVVGFVAVDAAKDEPVPAVERPGAAAAPAADASAQPQSAEAPKPDQQAFSVPQRQGLPTSANPIFESQTWQPPPPPEPQVKVKPAPPPPPTAPPLPYAFVGRLIHDGQLSMLLAKGDEVIPIRQGQTIDGIYRVESITDKQITLVYLPLNQTQTIPVITSLAESPPPRAPALAPPPPPLGSTPGAVAARALAPPIPTTNVVAPPGPAAAASPATVAWTGPQQVKLGTPFELSLRVNSNQPLHAWPLQLRVDTDRFEVLTVRPGKVAPGAPDPAFSYRMNADGSIFVGASVQQPAAAGDSEILALTLRPLKAAPSAEVSIASLSLQGAAGRPIPHAQLAAFRTTITP